MATGPPPSHQMLPARKAIRTMFATAGRGGRVLSCLFPAFCLSLLGLTWLIAGAGCANAAPGSVSLVWDNPNLEGVSDYAVYVGVRSGIYSRRILSNDKTNLTVNGLKDGVNYYF